MTVSEQALSVSEASRHLWEALSHHAVTLDLAANDPLVLAISAYGQACREHDQARTDFASKRVWEELSRHRVTLDLGARTRWCGRSPSTATPAAGPARRADGTRYGQAERCLRCGRTRT